MDYNQVQTLKLIINELELIGYNFELDVLDRAIYSSSAAYDSKVVYILNKNDTVKVYCKEDKKIYQIEDIKKLVPYPELDRVLQLLPFRSKANKIEGFLTFVKQENLQQDLVILALNYLLCVKKNSIGVNGILIDCSKAKQNKKNKKK